MFFNIFTSFLSRQTPQNVTTPIMNPHERCKSCKLCTLIVDCSKSSSFKVTMLLPLLACLSCCRRKRSGYFYDLQFTPKYDGSYSGDRLLPVVDDSSDETVRVLARLIKRYIREQNKRKLIKNAQTEVLRDFADSLRSILRHEAAGAKYMKALRRADLIRRRYRTDPMIDKFLAYDQELLDASREETRKLMEQAGYGAKKLVEKAIDGATNVFKKVSTLWS